MKLISAALLLFMMPAEARAQVRYQIDTSTATYVTRSGGTVIVEPSQNSTGCTTRTVQLPFPFYFDGRAHTEIRVLSNGYIGFGTDSCSTVNDPILDVNTPTSHVSLFWDDNENARVRTFI